MKTWICNTLCNFYGPLLGTARLYAYARKQGYDICFKDFNQNAYFTLLSREYLEPIFDKMQYMIDSVFRSKFLRKDLGSILLESSNNSMRQLVARGILLGSPWYETIKKTHILARPALSLIGSKVKSENILFAMLSEKEFILSEIERSRRALDDGFYSLAPDEFIANFCTLLCGKALIDAAYFPAQLDFGLGFHGNAFGPRTGDIIRGVESENQNFLIPYYRDKVLPMLHDENPALVGISITCVYELIPAFTLAHMIKKAAPDIHVVLGGILATQLSQRIVNNPPLWSMFDSLILGPGEIAFSELIEHLEKKSDLSGVSNIIYKDKGNIIKSDKAHEFDINEACMPEFVSARPKSGLPLETTSGCYWGKGIFCDYPKTGTAELESRYNRKRVRNMELVLNDIRMLKDNYNPLFIAFTDSSMHPKRLEAVAEDNLRSQKPVKFSALFRMEKEFKSKQFCRKLAEGGFLGGYVGLESGSQRVNNIINKGIELSDTEVVIRNFNDTGILLHVFSIIGTPGETRDDALMTYKFFRRWHRHIKLDWVIYYLYVLENSPIAQRASALGVKIMPLPNDFLVQATRYETETGLSQEESASLAIGFTEKLKRFSHPLSKIMDIESVALFLLAQKSKGIPPEGIKKTRTGTTDVNP